MHSVVYPFYAQSTRDVASLNLSIESVKLNYPHANIVVVGDPTSHTTIPSPRVSLGGFGKWFDSIEKLKKVINSPEVTDDFAFFYDDTFVLSPLTTIKDYYIPFKLDSACSGTWKQVWESTVDQLISCCPTVYNYSTHYPILFNKQKLQQTLDKFKQPYLIELVYLNLHATCPVPMDESFLFTRSDSIVIPDTVKVINVKKFTPKNEDAIRGRLLHRVA